MSTKELKPKSPFLFLICILVFSVPFYVFTGRSIPLSEELAIPVVSFMAWLPLLFAVLFTYRESGSNGVTKLLKKAVDFKKIKPITWVLPMIFLMPLTLHLAYQLSNVMGQSLPDPTPVWANPFGYFAIISAYLILWAIGEEVGWMGYAAGPLQQRWGAFNAGLFLGVIGAIWHIIPWYLLWDGSLWWVFWQCIFTIIFRILIFWLYNNTRGSIFAAAVFHATYNLSYRYFPQDGSLYDPFSTSIIAALFTALVLLLWDSKTLSKFRFTK